MYGVYPFPLRNKGVANALKLLLEAYKKGSTYCPVCGGYGFIVHGFDSIGNPLSETKCNYCNGSGRVTFDKFVEVLEKDLELVKELDQEGNLKNEEDEIDDIEF